MRSSLRSSLKLIFLAALGGAAIASAASACSGDTENQNTGSQGTGAAGSGGGQGGAGGSGGELAGGGGIFNPGGDDGGLDPDSACAAQSAEATLIKKPVDIIFVIDNSGSMGDDILAVENNINDNFINIIGASGVDYRVIMISDHGTNGGESICVKAPLSTTTCMPVPGEPGQNPPIFYQYSLEIGSHNSLCHLLNAYNATLPDDYGYAPNGWKDWLRTDALKVFVEVTDDGISCSYNGSTINDGDNVNAGMTAADNFDAALLALDPAQFGDATKRNYVWHSIIGVAENDPPTAAYLPADPIIDTKCSLGGTASPGPGTGYQALSVKTGGLRFPICQNASFDVVFQEIAKGVIEGAQVACDFPLPKPPEGQMLDLNTVVVEYTVGGVGTPTKFKQVKNAGECVADSFYIESETIKLCPDACSVVQKDDKAKLAILFGCDIEIQ